MDRSDAGWELDDATDLGQPVTVSEFDGIRLPLRESGAAVERQGRGACKAGCLCFVKHRGGDGGRLTRAGKLVGRVGQATVRRGVLSGPLEGRPAWKTVPPEVRTRESEPTLSGSSAHARFQQVPGEPASCLC